MVLYAADLDDLAPTKKISRKRKEKPAEESEELDVVSPPVEKKKRVLTDAQKEALKKGQEALRLKKEAELKTKQEHEELANKLQAAAKKPRTKKLKNLPVTTPIVESEIPTPSEPSTPAEPTEPADVEKKKRVKKEKKENTNPQKLTRKKSDPPAWFKDYVEGIQKEKAAAQGEVSKKQESIIKSEALKVAKKSWDNGYTRDRVQNEVDNHMSKMYSMIFGRA